MSCQQRFIIGTAFEQGGITKDGAKMVNAVGLSIGLGPMAVGTAERMYFVHQTWRRTDDSCLIDELMFRQFVRSATCLSPSSPSCAELIGRSSGLGGFLFPSTACTAYHGFIGAEAASGLAIMQWQGSWAAFAGGGGGGGEEGEEGVGRFN